MVVVVVVAVVVVVVWVVVVAVVVVAAGVVVVGGGGGGGGGGGVDGCLVHERLRHSSVSFQTLRFPSFHARATTVALGLPPSKISLVQAKTHPHAGEAAAAADADEQGVPRGNDQPGRSPPKRRTCFAQTPVSANSN